MLRSVCLFCGSSRGVNSTYADAAQRIGRLLSERGLGLVYGGGNVGLMGLVADACLNGGGRVTRVMPKHLAAKEIAHRNLTELHLVDSMHQRKALMADLSDAFIALPGGYGTWDEFCEVLTWSQLGIRRKACALLNVNGYYDPLLAMADRAVSEGFLRPVHRDLVFHDSDPSRLLDRLGTYLVPAVEKWIDPTER